MGVITVICGICGDTFRSYSDDHTRDQTTHGVCTRPECIDEYRGRLGLPPVDDDPYPKITASYIAEVNAELGRSLCESCFAPFDPAGCWCLPPYQKELK